MQTDLTLLAPGRIPLADRQVEEEVMEADLEKRLEAVEEAADASQVEMIRRFTCTKTSSCSLPSPRALPRTFQWLLGVSSVESLTPLKEVEQQQDDSWQRVLVSLSWFDELPSSSTLTWCL